ncbi:MAG: hypothetical protein AAF558_03045 [Verrucomicrobiota bacterium]
MRLPGKESIASAFGSQSADHSSGQLCLRNARDREAGTVGQMNEDSFCLCMGFRRDEEELFWSAPDHALLLPHANPVREGRVLDPVVPREPGSRHSTPIKFLKQGHTTLGRDLNTTSRVQSSNS